MKFKVIKKQLNDTDVVYEGEVVKEYINGYDILINGTITRIMKEDIQIIK